jgi:hypothetical protein
MITSTNTTSSLRQSEIKDEFGYDEINSILAKKIADKEKVSHTSGNYTAYVQTDLKTKDFIYFANDKYKPNKISECSDVGILCKIYGLKFHISLPEDDENSRAKGWKIIKDILIDKNINGFKIIKKDKKMSEVEEQRGKDITIYAKLNPELRARDWLAILQKITEHLVQAGVSPGYRCPGSKDEPEKPINGSNYITYRYDDEGGSRWDAINQMALRKLAQKTQQDTGEINGWPKYDPIALFLNVKVENQPNIPNFVSKSIVKVTEASSTMIDSNKPQ